MLFHPLPDIRMIVHIEEGHRQALKLMIEIRGDDIYEVPLRGLHADGKIAIIGVGVGLEIDLLTLVIENLMCHWIENCGRDVESLPVKHLRKGQQ